MLLIAGASKKLTEAGLLVGGLGAIVFAFGALAVIRGSRDRERERWATLIGGVLIAIAFGLQLVGLVSTSPAAKTPTSPPSGQVSTSPSP
jgi:hypothetical protein